MSFQVFISDMKKLFAVCAVCNFGAEIGQFGIISRGEHSGNVKAVVTQ